jgi:hypothetical protein
MPQRTPLLTNAFALLLLGLSSVQASAVVRVIVNSTPGTPLARTISIAEFLQAEVLYVGSEQILLLISEEELVPFLLVADAASAPTDATCPPGNPTACKTALVRLHGAAPTTSARDAVLLLLLAEGGAVVHAPASSLVLIADAPPALLRTLSEELSFFEMHTLLDPSPAVGLPEQEPAEWLRLGQEHRFYVRAFFETPTRTGLGSPILVGVDSGGFSFFSPNNLEIFIKILNGCSINDHWWLYISGLTDMATEIEIVDRMTDTATTYFNPQDTPFQAVSDVQAFPCG